MLLNLCYMGNTVMKSSLISVQICAGIRSVSSILNGFSVGDLKFWHESHSLTYLSTYVVGECQVKPCQNRDSGFHLGLLKAFCGIGFPRYGFGSGHFMCYELITF